MRLGEGPHKGEESLKWEGPHKGEESLKWEGPHKGEESLKREGPHKGEESLKWEGPHKGEVSLKWEGPHKGHTLTQVFASSSILPVVHNWPAQIEMITSGKSDERLIHSNKIQIFMYLKYKCIKKKNTFSLCCSVGMFGAKFLCIFLYINQFILFGWICLCFIRFTNCYNISSTFLS